MTRRERLERKIEKRLDWASGRRSKASALTNYTDRYRGDFAFNTQPGHIPERARVIGMIDRAIEHRGMADHHEAKAEGLQRQLDASIYSDDEDALDKIRERIAELEAQRERMKHINAEIRRGAGWEARLGCVGVTLTEREQRELLDIARLTPYHCDKRTGLPVFPSYVLTNLGGNIGRLKERLKTIEDRAERSAQAEASETGVLIEGDTWVRVTFAEKPDRSVLTALKAAGFRWGGGSWAGERAKLPAEVQP